MLKEILTNKNIFLLIISTVLLATSMVLFNPIVGSKQTYAADKLSGTPSFIKVGQTYSELNTQVPFTVLEIKDNGWILANSSYGKSYININNIFWLIPKGKP